MIARAGQEGFSLIEALVALLVLAIAAAGLVRAAEAHVDSIRGLERRAAAQLVAQNRLAELALPGARAGPSVVEMLGQRWNVVVSESATDDPDLAKVQVAVSDVGGRAPLVTLDGFRDKGTTTR
ncbi:type II secretion system minor pseudopilin GspI [Rhizorhabdus dicambivorans]|uniref:Type II secretion system protein I n=1 Tax=Rhizorhabdus dicambivorans TaxID=1850238 RepID=A0A2A4FUN8_9SPHN|nr:type II secretion system minor pseudopilin GspI [Rhizorhabdus dicambivorans]ATE63532.1 type II secretion system protein GspI [Rhizorhabdus dicambivorans]PCE41414.1 type II secretion system protein GspI [Rhizorhabdus dicambivorans]